MSAYLQAMETAVAFIEDHLQDDINLADVAAAVSYSLYHFCRIFNQTVHHPPYDYLMRRRLTAAAMLLVASASDTRITDVAFAFQFGTPEGFSRAFRRMFGQLPTQWRKEGMRDPRLLTQPITAAHLAQRNQPTFHRPRLIEKPAFTVVGLMTIAQPETAVATVRRDLRHHLAQPPTHLIHHYPDYWADRGKLIFAGNLADDAPPPLATQTVPAYTYAAFSLPETERTQPLLTDYIYQTWLPQSGYRLAAPLEVEHDNQILVPIAPGE